MDVSKKTQQRIAMIMGAILLVVLAGIVWRQVSPGFMASADDQSTETVTDADEADDTTSTQSKASPADKDAYAYVANPGDSYTLLARQSVARYAEKNNLVLTPFDALMAEIELANKAGSPELDVGQEVSLSNNELAAVLSAYDERDTQVAVEEDDATEPADSNENADAETPAAADADKPDDSESKPEPAASEIDSQSDDAAAGSKSYIYTAALGDSYSLLARDAISKYAAERDITLSPAQRLHAETHLAIAAGSPLLEVGDKIVFTESALSSQLDTASKLSPEQQLSWQVYLPSSEL